MPFSFRAGSAMDSITKAVKRFTQKQSSFFKQVSGPWGKLNPQEKLSVWKKRGQLFEQKVKHFLDRTNPMRMFRR